MDLRQRLDILTAKRQTESAPPAAGTAERLRRLLESSPRRDPIFDRPQRVSDEEVAACLGGTMVGVGVVLVETWLPLDHRHGSVALSSLLNAPLDALGVSGPGPNDLLFLDTETTGLAGGTGTLPFLLGLGRIEEDRLRLRQYFLTGFSGEQALLEHARAWIEAGQHLVSFNGKRFDVPLLLTRHRLRRLAWPLEDKAHLDLLYPTRSAFGSIWPDCRLQRAEANLLGFTRTDDLPGSLVPQVWGDFVRTGIMGAVPRILEHNRLDVITLAALVGELARVLAEPGYGDADDHALARSHLRAGQEDKALAHLRARRVALDTAGLLELARLYRRQGEWNEALAIWQHLSREGVADALLALAKYHEHKVRDYDKALEFCQALLARQPGEAAHHHRLDRICRKQADSRGG